MDTGDVGVPKDKGLPLPHSYCNYYCPGCLELQGEKTTGAESIPGAVCSACKLKGDVYRVNKYYHAESGRPAESVGGDFTLEEAYALCNGPDAEYSEGPKNDWWSLSFVRVG